jgi:NADH-quinone oxidoreductase subunit N
MAPVIPKVNYLFLGPELLLIAAGLALLLADLFIWRGRSRILAAFGIVALLATGAMMVPLIGVNGSTLNNMLIVDPFALFFKMLFLTAAILVIVLSVDYVAKHNFSSVGEYYTMLLFATVGMMFMAASTDLIMIYIGLELTSVACYVCAGYHKKDPKSNESVLKYFLLGLIASSMMLYGFSFIYGFTGHTQLTEIARALTGESAGLAVVAGVIFALAGFAFKVASVPFHQWVPDVYEGAPTPVTAFLSIGPKAAAFAALARILFIGFPMFVAYWQIFFIAMAIASMFIGNLLAIPQTNIKRMLAYSSIAHAGYIMVGFAVASSDALAGVLVYLVAYLVMNIGAFAVIMAVGHERDGGEQLINFSGLAKRAPYLALSMAVFMIALAGMPPTAGLWGKFYIFKAAVGNELWWLALLGLLNSVVSLYYYANVIRHMYLLEPARDEPLLAPKAFSFVVSLTFAAVLLIGILPDLLFRLALLSTKGFG